MNQKRKVFIIAILFVFCCLNAVILHAESCTTVGVTQNKYEARGCTYETKTRKCCSNKTWSEWGGDCPIACEEEGKSFSSRHDTWLGCWNSAKSMTNNVPKCTKDTQTNCYIMINPSGYESYSGDNCVKDNCGGTTSIISTVRYNWSTPAGYNNCYFEGLRYRVKC